MKENSIFALDIGTRTVVGIIAHKLPDNSLEILDIEVKEHPKRSMIGGQIHDIPKVAKTIADIKNNLENRLGYPLKKVAVAAAGRALITTKGRAEMNFIYPQEVKEELFYALMLDAVRKAQQATLGSNKAIDYHCVGYSIIQEYLDEIPIGSLLGQTGSQFATEIIATFLPRMVIDSLQNALRLAGLEIKYITLEPIAAMNLVVPDNVRQLNVALIDIGAGTSDIAISEKGTIRDYAMLPIAGDQITDALCQEYLLDFSIGEDLKKQLNSTNELVTFKDVTGNTYSYTRDQVVYSIRNTIELLSRDIGKKLVEVNGRVPQVVLCVGGGSLTPNLQIEIAKSLGLPENRVVIGDKEITSLITSRTDKITAPQAVTPLAIAADALLHRNLELHTIFVNNRPVRLFAIHQATAGDALIGAGITPSQYLGRLGQALSFEVNGKISFIKGEPGKVGKIEIDGKEGDLTTPVREGCNIVFVPGVSGAQGQGIVKNILPAHLIDKTITLNNVEFPLLSSIKLNNKIITDLNRPINDGDKISYVELKTVQDAVKSVVSFDTGEKLVLDVFLNGSICENLQQQLKPGDNIQVNDKKKIIQQRPLGKAEIQIKLNGQDTFIPKISKGAPVILTDVFKIIDLKPEESRGKKLIMLVNDVPANFMTNLNEGDFVTIKWEEQLA